jgi:hypothetical protein
MGLSYKPTPLATCAWAGNIPGSAEVSFLLILNDFF